MCSLERFKIDLKGLTAEETPLQWDLDDRFFEQLDDAQVQGGALHVTGSIRKGTGFYELRLHAEGTVRIACDRCLDDMDQPVEADSRYVVKLGAEAGEDGDTIVVDEAEATLHTAWLIYEAVALAIPLQHVHAPGQCNPDMAQRLEELTADDRQTASRDVDPRWEKLKALGTGADREPNTATS